MKKKVQIRSFIKGGNHGQYFQALGLHEEIKSNFPDYDVSHLDYSNHFFKELLIQIKKLQLVKFFTMYKFWKKNLRFSKMSQKNDVTIYGSDMIWHLESKLWPKDEIFFGKNDDTAKRISYAPSVASRGKNEPFWLKERFKAFDAIGVRDFGTKNFVLDHSEGREVQLVCDPCFFLLNSKFLEKIVSKSRKNKISVYSTLAHSQVTPFLKKINSENAEIEFLGYFPRISFFRYFKEQLKDPLDAIRSISEAKFLFTSTFHGVMMAIMTNTPFIAISSPNLDARLNSPISECFGSHRRCSIEELMNLDEERVSNLLSRADLDEAKLNSYINDSRSWLKQKIEMI